MSFGFGFGFPKNYVAALFSPAQLFTGSTNGVWYDPSDFSTMFQDAAGTTPVTAVGQPVGLMLDKSKGLVLGPELVTNGDFSNGTTGWTAVRSTLSASSGALVVTGTDMFPGVYQSFSTVAGKTYQVNFSIVSLGNSITIRSDPKNGTTDTGTALGSADFTTVGQKTMVFRATGTTSTVFILCQQALIANFTIDNISVRELPGNHAYNPSGNSANFPVLSARYNLLTKTEDFSDAVWIKSGSSTAPNSSTLNFPNTNEAISQTATMTATVGTTATFSVELSGSGTTNIGCYRLGGAAYEEDNKQITLTSIPTRYSVSHTMVNAGQTGFGGYISRSTGSTATTVTASKAQLIYTNDALGQPAYQRVNTATDYDTVGFKPYLSFNGVNQWLQTNNIDFTYGDKMFVCAGVRKLSDAARGMVVEATGGFNVSAPAAASPTYSVYNSGSVGLGPIVSASIFPAPESAVLSFIGGIAAPRTALRRNSSYIIDDATSLGASNYGNYPLYIGARAGSSLWFNGRMYGLVVAGKQASASEITSTETYLNQKTGAY